MEEGAVLGGFPCWGGRRVLQVILGTGDRASVRGGAPARLVAVRK